MANNKEIDIYKKLKQKINPDIVKTRKGTGNKELSYIEGWQAQQNANDVFKFDWDCKTISNDYIMQRDYIKKSEWNGKKTEKEMVQVAFKAIVEIVVRFEGKTLTRQGTGFGDGIAGVDNIAGAYELAMKEAETDACKRALKTLGSQFGIDLYDKTYSVTKGYEADLKSNKDYFNANTDISKITEDSELVKYIDEYQGSYKEEVIELAKERRKEIRK